MADKKEETAKPEAAKAEVGGAGGGAKSWLPLVVVIVLMPALAFVTTQFLVIPKVIQARGGAPAGDAAHGTGGGDAHGGTDAHGKETHDAKAGGKDAHGAKDGGAGKAGGKKQSFQLQKVIVNVSGTMGTRYLMTSTTLVGTGADFKTVMEEHKDQLLDIANGALGSKTISDLEKPGARNQLRSELISSFNNALGGGVVQEIYFTEFAIQ
jgi:flagellar FliL protein